MDLFTRRNADREKWGERLPPGQKATEGWPVLHYGSIPKIDLGEWTLQVSGLVERDVTLTWEEFQQLPTADLSGDIHCVTGWSKFDNSWSGVPVSSVLAKAQVREDARHVIVHSYGGYTTNLALDALDRPENLLATAHNGEPLMREHGWPLRLVVPHLYFWKSAKWIKGLELISDDKAGFWETYGYHMEGDPFKEERYG